MHNSVFGGHLGTKKTIEKLRQKHYWYNMQDDVKTWIKQCDVFAANKYPKRKYVAPLGDMHTGAPMDHLGVDIMGPLPLGHKGNKYIQVITDYFTKWVEIQAIPDMTAATCAEHLVDAVVSRFRSPLSLHSDQGRNNESRIITKLCHLLEIRKTRTTPKGSQGMGKQNGSTTLWSKWSNLLSKQNKTGIDIYLSCLAVAYRSSKHETTGFSPNFLMLGREVRLPGELSPPNSNLTLASTPGGTRSQRDRLCPYYRSWLCT